MPADDRHGPGTRTLPYEPEEALRKPGEPGATAQANARDAAIIKLAESFGELAREAAEALRDNRENVNIDSYQLVHWNRIIRDVLKAELSARGLTWAGVSDGLELGTGHQADELPRWWWELKEGVYDEIASYREPADLDAPVQHG